MNDKAQEKKFSRILRIVPMALCIQQRVAHFNLPGTQCYFCPKEAKYYEMDANHPFCPLCGEKNDSQGIMEN